MLDFIADIARLGDISRMKALPTVLFGVLDFGLLSCGNQTHAKPVHCPANIQLANLVSESDLILVGSPSVPVELLRSAMLRDSPDYVNVPLLEPTFLKGTENLANLHVRVYPKRTTYAPSPEDILRQMDKPTLFFLTRTDEGPVGLYLFHSLDAVQDASASRLEDVRGELDRQRSVLRGSNIDRSLPHFNEVRQLLSELSRASAQRQEGIFRQLEALGRNGVPAIVAQMDDHRPLPYPRISLVNHDPNAFEGLRHYGPKLVVDALDAILNQITGFGGSIVNGGSERERRNAVEAWRVHAADLKCG